MRTALREFVTSCWLLSSSLWPPWGREALPLAARRPAPPDRPWPPCIRLLIPIPEK